MAYSWIILFCMIPLVAGLLISAVEEGSPAEAAGVLLGDTLLALDGTATDALSDVATLLARHAPGDAVALDGHVAPEPGRPGAVHHAGVEEEESRRRLLPGSAGGQQRQPQQEGREAYRKARGRPGSRGRSHGSVHLVLPSRSAAPSPVADVSARRARRRGAAPV